MKVTTNLALNFLRIMLIQHINENGLMADVHIATGDRDGYEELRTAALDLLRFDRELLIPLDTAEEESEAFAVLSIVIDMYKINPIYKGVNHSIDFRVDLDGTDFNYKKIEKSSPKEYMNEMYAHYTENSGRQAAPLKSIEEHLGEVKVQGWKDLEAFVESLKLSSVEGLEFSVPERIEEKEFFNLLTRITVEKNNFLEPVEI